MNGTKVFPNGFKQRADDEDVVEYRKADQNPVEDGSHLFAQKNWDGYKVSCQTNCSNDYLKYKYDNKNYFPKTNTGICFYT